MCDHGPGTCFNDVTVRRTGKSTRLWLQQKWDISAVCFRYYLEPFLAIDLVETNSLSAFPNDLSTNYKDSRSTIDQCMAIMGDKTEYNKICLSTFNIVTSHNQ